MVVVPMEDVQEVNPLHLSLEELIALNKGKNKAMEQSLDEVIAENKLLNTYKDTQNASVRTSTNWITRNGHAYNGCDRYSINKRLREIPGFGSRPIHSRLGYTNFMKRRTTMFRNPSQKMAQQVVNRARIALWKKGVTMPLNPTISFKNLGALKKRYIAPLTTNSVVKFNRINYGGIYNHSIGSRSQFSTRTRFTRHSVAKSLCPELQEEIKLLMAEPEFCVEIENLEDYKVTPICTNTSTSDRFSRYT